MAAPGGAASSGQMPQAAGATPQPGPTAIVDASRIQGQAQPASFGGGAAAAMADTDPQGRPAPDTSGPARMVILSTNFAGQEYELNKPAMVIGRTDDNDIVVNHRSISRHHAKIVRENGRYAIVDLQSSNGVRVNGEEYGKVELRRGDTVDLGHVRLRFVEAGEDFLFGRDAHPVDISTGGGKGLIFALLALLVIGGGIGIFAMTGGGGGDEPETAAAAGDGDEPATAAAAPTDDDDDDTAPAPAADDPVGKLLGEARTAVQAEQWKEAKQAAEKALAEDADNAEAQELIDQAEREMANQIKYEAFKKAVTGKDYPKIAKQFEQIDPTSVYKEQARDDHDRLRDEYLADLDAKIARLATNCRKLKAIKVPPEWTAAGEKLQSAINNCEQAVAAKKDTRRTTKRSSSGGSSSGGSSSGGSSSGGSSSGGSSSGGSSSGGSTSSKSAAELTNEARAAAKTGHWGKALRLCESALAKKSSDQEAAMVCALAACNIKSASKAKKYMKKLRSPSRKGMARQICLKNGVDIPLN
jgi:pSer/pThr/pTyr-binding forkhead associated (FHA) protein